MKLFNVAVLAAINFAAVTAFAQRGAVNTAPRTGTATGGSPNAVAPSFIAPVQSPINNIVNGKDGSEAAKFDVQQRRAASQDSEIASGNSDGGIRLSGVAETPAGEATELLTELSDEISDSVEPLTNLVTESTSYHISAQKGVKSVARETLNYAQEHEGIETLEEALTFGATRAGFDPVAIGNACPSVRGTLKNASKILSQAG